jgi:hypothetical protein
MSVDPKSVWYLARDGSIVWQGTASELQSIIEQGDVEGNEAAWSDGLSAWVPVSSHPKCAWIRDAVADNDERTGLHTEYSNPQGTAALNLPTYVEETNTPFAGDPPGRERSDKGGRRATDQPGASGRSGRRPQDRRVIGTVGLPVGLLAGVAIGLGAAYLLWHEIEGRLPKSPPAPATELARDASSEPQVADAGQPEKPPVIKPTQAGEKILLPPAAPTTAVPTTAAPTTAVPTTAAPATPEPATDAGKVTPTNSVVRIVKRKPRSSVTMPTDSADRNQEIQRSMKVRKAIWDACILRAQRDYPALIGRLLFTISVTKQGTINGVTGPAGNAGAQYAAACLLGEFSNLSFPPGRAAQVKFAYKTP